MIYVMHILLKIILQDGSPDFVRIPVFLQNLTYSIFFHKFLHLIKRNYIKVIIQICMNRIRNSQKLFVCCIFTIFYHSFISILGKVIAMSFVTMHNKHCASDLIDIFKNRLIHKGLTTKTIPAFVRVKASCMVTSVFVIFTVIFYNDIIIQPKLNFRSRSF